MTSAEPESGSRLALDGFLRSHLLVGDSSVFDPCLPGLSRVTGEQARAPTGSQLAAVRIQFEALGLNTARHSLAWVNDRLVEGTIFRIDEREEEVELIDDAARIRGIVSALIASEARGHAMLHGSARGERRRTVELRLTREGNFLWSVPPDASLQGSAIEVQVQGFSSVYLFDVPVRNALLPPTTMVRVRRRRFRRVAAPRRLRLTAPHPLWREIVIDARATDVSEQGVCIETDAVRDMLYPGLRLKSVELRWKGGQPIKAEAVVAHVTQQSSSALHRVGLRLLLRGAEASRWHLELEELLHPRTTRGEPDASTFWKVYVDSGYFHLSGKSEREFVDERAAFEQSQEHFRGAPDVAAFFASSSKRRTESVAHQTSLWHGSWIYYQFCRLPEMRPLSAADDGLLLDLYAHAYEHVQSRPDARWLVTYVQEVARFSRLIFYDVAERYRAQGRASIWRFRALEVDCAQGDSSELDYEVSQARALEISALKNRIHQLRSQIYIEATGLSASDLGIGASIEAWEAAGLMRARVVLIARTKAGSPVAGAVLDAVNAGVHLFGLLDMARLFPLVDGGEDAYDSLLAAARRWFGGLGKRKFTYFADESEDPEASKRSVTDLGRAFMTILPVELLPELLEHVFCVTCVNQPSSLSQSSTP
ncbi:MAG TPA: PilZ domain-containing protein [Polyangiaceae bacterium]|nr:PilZ domain-containing protein [Polyangiaceae bacterium]